MKIKELKEEILESEAEKERAETNWNTTHTALLTEREEQRKEEEEWKEFFLSRENERLEFKAQINHLLSRVRLTKD